MLKGDFSEKLIGIEQWQNPGKTEKVQLTLTIKYYPGSAWEGEITEWKEAKAKMNRTIGKKTEGTRGTEEIQRKSTFLRIQCT